MSENPFQFLFLNIGKLSNSIQTHLSNLIDPSNDPPNLLLSVSSSTTTPLTRDRNFLLNKYPDNPKRQQKRDVKELMVILSRMMNPVQAGSHADFSRWLCYVYNVVNRRLGKPGFPCEWVDARWGKLDCGH